MSFNPLKEKGMPIEKQIRSWTKLNSKPYPKGKVHPYTRVRGIFMNGIEVEAALFSHQFHRHCEDMELRRQLALVRRIEQQQQKAINWLIPAGESVLEVTLGTQKLPDDKLFKTYQKQVNSGRGRLPAGNQGPPSGKMASGTGREIKGRLNKSLKSGRIVKGCRAGSPLCRFEKGPLLTFYLVASLFGQSQMFL
jgi:hypothetical protein